MESPPDVHRIHLTLHGEQHDRDVPAHLILTDLLRHDLSLTGTRAACGSGPCTVLIDSRVAL